MTNKLFRLILAILLAIEAAVTVRLSLINSPYIANMTVGFWTLMAVYMAVTSMDILEKRSSYETKSRLWLRKEGSREWKGPFHTAYECERYLKKMHENPKDWLIMTYYDVLKEVVDHESS